jgi:hypothetical protein
MADNMSVILANHMKKILSEARFYAISVDKVTTIDQESCLGVHIYISIGFSCVPIVLLLLQLTEGIGAFAVKESIMTSLN